MSGTHDGELRGLPPTGKPASFTSMGVRRFVDGQAVERWGVGDALAMIGQLGLLG